MCKLVTMLSINPLIRVLEIHMKCTQSSVQVDATICVHCHFSGNHEAAIYTRGQCDYRWPIGRDYLLHRYDATRSWTTMEGPHSAMLSQEISWKQLDWHELCLIYSLDRGYNGIVPHGWRPKYFMIRFGKAWWRSSQSFGVFWTRMPEHWSCKNADFFY